MSSLKGRHPQRTPSEAKTEMKDRAEAAMEQFWNWVKETPTPTLTQIEDAVLKFRQQIGQAMAEAAIQSQASVQPVPGPQCPKCGKEMQLKGSKNKTVTSRVGAAGLERNHYYWSRCGQGLFPPG